jgi:hypothetical protein
VVIAALGFKTEELKPGSKNDLRWSLETAAKHLYERSDPSHGLRLVCECGFNWTREGADAKLKALGSEIDALDKAKINPIEGSVELNAARNKMRTMFNDLMCAKLIPEDATYVRYFPAPAGKK